MFDGFNTAASIKGRVTIYEHDRPENVLYQRQNVICAGISYLFARLLTNSADPVAGVWGLALGSGGVNVAGWSASEQPDPTAVQTAMVAEIKRKAITNTTYIDGNGNPTTALTTKVEFTTIFNATSDNVTLPIREMGLIGGGTTLAANGGPTAMLTAPYFSPTAPEANSIVLVNYITTPPLILPASVNLAFAWQLSF